MVYNTVEFYPAFKKKEILPYVTTRMNVEEILLVKLVVTEGQILHDCNYMSYLNYLNHRIKLIDEESKMVVAKGLGEGSLLFSGYKILIMQDE